eukprot:m.129617 g.129617  ORF g.129617 m.129617 type:complete len:438 (+) comp15700_c0_seq1:46-1359(+)
MCICIVCDFYLPNLGGVEAHIHQIATHLSTKGLKVVIVTHEYKEHKGVTRDGDLITYYLPLPVMWRENTYPTIVGAFPILRRLFLFEGVTIVHGHSAFSTLCHEALLCGSLLGLKTIYTDHSILDMTEFSNRAVAKILAFTLSHTQHSICVSHTCREHLVLNTGVDANVTSVIPNAVDASHFQPLSAKLLETENAPPTIVVISRLFWRKGIDLLAAVIPLVCAQHDTVRFIIGGDGPMRIHLEEMREAHNLSDRVQMLGSVFHADVPTVLRKGSIFLNCSRTEAFCMAILEAACCGLYVVSTNVGGVPEVLPPSMCTLCDPNPKALAEAVLHTLQQPVVGSGTSQHEQLSELYSWSRVTERTRRIYDSLPTPKPLTMAQLFKAWRPHGLLPAAGFAFMYIIARLVLLLLSYLQPSSRYTGSDSMESTKQSQVKGFLR